MPVEISPKLLSFECLMRLGSRGLPNLETKMPQVVHYVEKNRVTFITSITLKRYKKVFTEFNHVIKYLM